MERAFGAVGTAPPSIVAGGVSVSFTNLEISEIGEASNGFGGTAGYNQVVVADQLNFSGKFLTAAGFGRAMYRTAGFVRTIAFDVDVENVSMYVADMDAGESITANAFDEFDTLLSSILFPRTGNSRAQLVDFGTLSGIRKVTLVGDDPVGIDNLSFDAVVRDADGDGVPDDADNCPNTMLTESLPTRSLGVNRFALVDGDNVFDTTSPKGKGPRRSYTTGDTTGCSCTQIIDALGLGNGHTMFGCSISAMDDWVELVNP